MSIDTEVDDPRREVDPPLRGIRHHRVTVWVTMLVASVASNVGAAPPDVVVTDMRMPGLSGLNVLQAVRGLHLRVPVVVITAFGDAGTHEAATTAGAAVVLDKPFAIRDLLAHVNHLLERPE